jgi:hypothetical protein
MVVFSFFLAPKAYSASNSKKVGNSSDFTFVAFGDGRIPGYYPYKESQVDTINSLLGEVWAYDQGQVPYGLELKFNKTTKRLESNKIFPQAEPDNYMEAVLKKDGWIEKVFQGPSGIQTLRAEGQSWVYKNVLAELRKYTMNPTTGPGFAVHTGDITFNGLQGKGKNTSPYWRAFNEDFMDKIPKDTPDGLVGRLFPSPGNHETWADETIQGFRETFPYLSKLGFTENNRIYKFDYKNSRFIFLDSGDCHPGPTKWYSNYPDFNSQMNVLKSWLNEAIENKIKHVFVTYHDPSFTLVNNGALIDSQNPHSVLKQYGSRLDISVINGHVHTTEFYVVDGVRYCLVGAGGGEQNLGLFPQTSGYPTELYWKGAERIEEYSYLTVQVSGDSVAMFLHRWRPTKGTTDVVQIF